jgi:hypothetical protein
LTRRFILVRAIPRLAPGDAPGVVCMRVDDDDVARDEPSRGGVNARDERAMMIALPAFANEENRALAAEIEVRARADV